MKPEPKPCIQRSIPEVEGNSFLIDDVVKFRNAPYLVKRVYWKCDNNLAVKQRICLTDGISEFTIESDDAEFAGIYPETEKKMQNHGEMKRNTDQTVKDLLAQKFALQDRIKDIDEEIDKISSSRIRIANILHTKFCKENGCGYTGKVETIPQEYLRKADAVMGLLNGRLGIGEIENLVSLMD